MSNVLKHSFNPGSGLPARKVWGTELRSHFMLQYGKKTKAKKRHCSKQVSLTSSDVQNNCGERNLNMKNSLCWSEACITTVCHIVVFTFTNWSDVNFSRQSLSRVQKKTKPNQNSLKVFFLVLHNFHLRTKKSQVGERNKAFKILSREVFASNKGFAGL